MGRMVRNGKSKMEHTMKDEMETETKNEEGMQGNGPWTMNA